MDDERDPEATLRAWKESMAAEHETAIEEPDPTADHSIEAVVQLSVRLRFSLVDGRLVERDREQVEAGEPELFSCACGVRGMTRAEAREHLIAAED
ncbi:hypothetical protein [Halosegnis sp.]|uniref:hypothetical protein n=1 Tax=Halosegnis sp. TaxID=2864959 RepID=UPI0035D5179A